MDLLKTIPVKVLKFAEDVRPPYIGTYTRLRDAQSISRLARNPFRRELPQTNYDYDSEAEWEEPGEGEDLDSEGEEEIEDEDEADMEGFLDDEETDARAIKRRPILGDLEPTCSGIFWEGPQAQGPEKASVDLLVFKLDVLMGEDVRHSVAIKLTSQNNRNYRSIPIALRTGNRSHLFKHHLVFKDLSWNLRAYL